MKILVISNNYPSEAIPSRGVFVYNLIQQFAKLGHDVTVIAPVGVVSKMRLKQKRSYGEELCKVYRPQFISASNKKIFGFNTYRIAEWSQVMGVRRTIHRYAVEFDVVYAHFLTNAFIASEATRSYGKPVFAAIGESDLEVPRAQFRKGYFKNMIESINGYVAVSPLLKDKLVSFGVLKDKVIVKPNAVDFDVFYQRDKIRMRKKHNLPLDKKLVIFVGRFIDHKGPLRALEAARKVEDVRLIFVGAGDQVLNDSKIVFSDKIPFEVVPELLSAADVFVLPTQKEGSCNAIIEAMACGLPIISSKIAEVELQCDPSYAILVDPLDISAIRNAIEKVVMDAEKAKKMSENALAKSKRFNIKERANDILNFIGAPPHP